MCRASYCHLPNFWNFPLPIASLLSSVIEYLNPFPSKIDRGASEPIKEWSRPLIGSITWPNHHVARCSIVSSSTRHHSSKLFSPIKASELNRVSIRSASCSLQLVTLLPFSCTIRSTVLRYVAPHNSIRSITIPLSNQQRAVSATTCQLMKLPASGKHKTLLKTGCVDWFTP